VERVLSQQQLSAKKIVREMIEKIGTVTYLLLFSFPFFFFTFLRPADRKRTNPSAKKAFELAQKTITAQRSACMRIQP